MNIPNPVPDPTANMSERDKQLWRIARKRVGFRRHLFSYLVVNGFLWAVWFFSGGFDGHRHDGIMFPWPLWCTLGWGIGLMFNYYNAYHGSGIDAIDKEFEKLKNRSSNQNP
ncbi:MAG: hypothetical protein FD123_1515 [Bacteroidetes bacterium]|nr:MAG: hypothetical protein FD123_1515 [Bacteroidota bacterium]